MGWYLVKHKTFCTGWLAVPHEFNLLSISSWLQFWCVTVAPKYWNSATSLNYLLSARILWFCPASQSVQWVGYGSDDRNSISSGTWIFSLRHRVQTGSVAHSFLSNGYQRLFTWTEAAGTWSWPLSSSAEVKNAWSYTSTPPYVFRMCFLVKHKIRLQGVLLS